MKRVILVVCGVLCVCVGWNGRGEPAAAEVIDKIVAILDGELVLLSEVRELVEKPVSQIFANLSQTDDFDSGALSYVIERHLLTREIQYLAHPKEKEFITAVALRYLAETYHQGSLDALRQQMLAQKLSDSVIEKELLLYMKGVDYIRRKFRFTTDVSDPDAVLNLFQKWLQDLKAKTNIQKL